VAGVGQRGHDQGVDPLVGGHGRGRLGVGVVVAGGLGPLDQAEHDQ